MHVFFQPHGTVARHDDRLVCRQEFGRLDRLAISSESLLDSLLGSGGGFLAMGRGCLRERAAQIAVAQQQMLAQTA
ncbi:MAG: hypothetical protein P8X82_12045, partial [Gemmatimonadales bacterium]